MSECPLSFQRREFSEARARTPSPDDQAGLPRNPPSATRWLIVDRLNTLLTPPPPATLSYMGSRHPSRRGMRRHVTTQDKDTRQSCQHGQIDIPGVLVTTYPMEIKTHQGVARPPIYWQC